MRYQFWPLRQITGSHFDAMPDLQVHTVLPAFAPKAGEKFSDEPCRPHAAIDPARALTERSCICHWLGKQSRYLHETTIVRFISLFTESPVLDTTS